MSKGPPSSLGGPFIPLFRWWAPPPLGGCGPEAYLLKPSRNDSPMRRAASAMVSIIPLAPSE